MRQLYLECVHVKWCVKLSDEPSIGNYQSETFQWPFPHCKIEIDLCFMMCCRILFYYSTWVTATRVNVVSQPNRAIYWKLLEWNISATLPWLQNGNKLVFYFRSELRKYPRLENKKICRNQSSRQFTFPIVNSCHCWQIMHEYFNPTFPEKIPEKCLEFFLFVNLNLLKKYLCCLWSRLQIEFRKWLNFMPNCGLNI